ncbi:hypothetical protein DKP78_20080, partial [Enterococcus faecium]
MKRKNERKRERKRKKTATENKREATKKQIRITGFFTLKNGWSVHICLYMHPGILFNSTKREARIPKAIYVWLRREVDC